MWELSVEQRAIISLLNSALYNTKTVLPQNFDWEKAKNIIIRQNIVGLINFGLYNSGLVIPDWLRKKFQVNIGLLERLWQNGAEIMDAFKKSGVDYVPLKGVILKDLYPSPYMRQMSDVDILIREEEYEDKIKPIMLALGYEEGVKSDHELHFIKNNQLIELHKRIIPSYNKDFYSITGDGWEWVQNHGYAYIFTHFAKHYRDSGIGITHLLDLEILKDRATDDGLTELHLDKFYENVKRTLDCWFRGKEFDEITLKITRTIFESGEYGTMKTSVQSKNLKKVDAAHGDAKKARRKDLMRLIFPSYGEMKTRNPVLKKLPVLLPFFWAGRIVCAPFRGNVKKMYKANKAITDDKVDYREELNAVGLDFWF